MGGNKYNPGHIVFVQHAEHFDTGYFGHVDIKKYNIRMFAVDVSYCLKCIGACADDIEGLVGADFLFQVFAGIGFIINNHCVDHACSLLFGR